MMAGIDRMSFHAKIDLPSLPLTLKQLLWRVSRMMDALNDERKFQMTLHGFKPN